MKTKLLGLMSIGLIMSSCTFGNKEDVNENAIITGMKQTISIPKKDGKNIGLVYGNTISGKLAKVITEVNDNNKITNFAIDSTRTIDYSSLQHKILWRSGDESEHTIIFEEVLYSQSHTYLVKAPKTTGICINASTKGALLFNENNGSLSLKEELFNKVSDPSISINAAVPIFYGYEGEMVERNNSKFTLTSTECINQFNGYWINKGEKFHLYKVLNELTNSKESNVRFVQMPKIIIDGRSKEHKSLRKTNDFFRVMGYDSKLTTYDREYLELVQSAEKVNWSHEIEKIKEIVIGMTITELSNFINDPVIWDGEIISPTFIADAPNLLETKSIFKFIFSAATVAY